MIRHKLMTGFTLIEMTVGISIMAMIGLAVLGLQYIIGQSQTTLFNQSIKVEIANTSIAAILREIRTARSGENGAYVIETGENQSFVFYSDVDFDGQTEKIRYFLEGTELKKGVIQPTGFPATYPMEDEVIRIVAENVQNSTLPIFYFYNSDWPEDVANNPLATPVDSDNVRMVRVYLRINTKPEDTDNDYVLDSFAQIRTLKDNL